jgi:hypothetical protein
MHVILKLKSGTFDVEVKRDSVRKQVKCECLGKMIQTSNPCVQFTEGFFRDSGCPEKKPLQTFHLDPGLVWKKRIFYSLSFALF